MMALITVKKLFISFRHLIHQIAKDAMLFFVCISPLLCGLLIRFGIPFVENLLTEHFDKVILLPYYLIFDLFLAVITAAMFSFASAMVILGEIDDGITSYLAITPIGKSGYLVSRLVFPLILSLFMSIVVLIVFSLTRPSVSMILIISIMASIFGFIMSMIVVSMSTNKVEGLAVMKLSNILTIGIIAPFLVSEKFQIIFFLFPSFNDKLYTAECLKAVGMYELRDRQITTLSGGQLQRVYLARTLAQEPSIILLDEPTNHLDLKNQAELIDYLKEWSKIDGHTVIGVLHDINLAMRLADNVLVLDNGKTAALGKADEVITSNLLNKVYDMDVVGFMTDSLKRWESFQSQPYSQVTKLRKIK